MAIGLGLVLLCVVAAANLAQAKYIPHKQSAVEAYYWRDYLGDIPHDALVGGKTKHEEPIFIGQIMHDKNLQLPAKIYEGKKEAFYEYATHEHCAKNLIKVFATHQPGDFEWVKTTSEDLDHLRDEHELIVGGSEGSEEHQKPIYVGRHLVDDELLVGKVLVGDGEFTGLHVTKDGKSVHCKTFEVLVYKPKSLALIKELDGKHHQDYKIINIHID